jgi:hypothetical protein
MRLYVRLGVGQVRRELAVDLRLIASQTRRPTLQKTLFDGFQHDAAPVKRRTAGTFGPAELLN